MQHAAAFQTINPASLDPRLASVPSAELVSKATLTPKPIGMVESKDDDAAYSYFSADTQETAI